ncbi:MAG: hypothetical protein ACFCD0_15705 [Gemmataceae bacterium]
MAESRVWTPAISQAAPVVPRGPKVCIRYPYGHSAASPITTPRNFVADGTCSPHANVRIKVSVWTADFSAQVSNELTMVPVTGNWSAGPFFKAGTTNPLDPNTEYQVVVVLVDLVSGDTLDSHVVKIKTDAISDDPGPIDVPGPGGAGM